MALYLQPIDEKLKENTGKKMASSSSVYVVLDGANVSTRDGGQRHIPRLAAALAFFQELQRSRQCDLRCVAFVPNFWLHVKPTDSHQPTTGTGMDPEDSKLLQQLVDQEAAVLTPSHAHDDFYVIDYAVKNDGFIVTNDMFRDHVQHKRVFQGRKLTQSWVRARCIDFTFVGNEFLPNSQAIERAITHVPNTTRTTNTANSGANGAASATGSAAAVPRLSVSTTATTTPAPVRLRTPTRTSSLARAAFSNSQDKAEEEEEEEEDDDDEDEDQEDDDATAMAMDHVRKKNVDLSELTPYRVPRHLLPLLHGDDGQTMARFQDHTSTYIVVPSLASAAAVSPSAKTTNVATLSIYGPEANRLQAVKILDAALPDLQRQFEYQVHQEQQQQQQQQWLLQQQQHYEQEQQYYQQQQQQHQYQHHHVPAVYHHPHHHHQHLHHAHASDDSMDIELE